MYRGRKVGWQGAFFLLAASALAQNSVPTFGTTVVDSSGLRGEIFLLKPGTEDLPNFKRLHPIGTIYTNALNVAPRDFREGFPGITDRNEWFAIDYRGRFWVDRPKTLRFGLSSDDGSRLYIDNRLVIDNDGGHPPSGCIGQALLSQGVHDIRVSYFQGPRYFVALVLVVALQNQGWQIFDTSNFRPPPDFDANARRAGPSLSKLRRGNCWAQ